jgi:hypothetical protein
MFRAQSQPCVIVLQIDLLRYVLDFEWWLEYLPLTDLWATRFTF